MTEHKPPRHLSNEREISVRYLFPRSGPKGASQKRYRTLISRPILRFLPSFILCFAFLSQLLCLQRAFPAQACSSLLGAAMFFAAYWAWLRTRVNQTLPLPSTKPRTVVVAFAMIVAFAFATSTLIEESDTSLIRFAFGMVFAMLVGQIVTVALHGLLRTELLVFATIATITSVVCVEEAVPLYRQIAEAGLAICLFALLASLGSVSSSFEDYRHSWHRSIISIAVLAVVVLVSRPVATAMDSWFPTLQLQLSGVIDESVIEDYRAPSVVRRYVDTASLNDVVDQFAEAPGAVALRVYSDQTPGYLRGRAFSGYAKGRWIRIGNGPSRRLDEGANDDLRASIINADSITSVDAANLPSARHDGVEPSRLNRFSLRGRVPRNGGSSGMLTLEIANDPRRGEFFFLPLQATTLVGVGRRIMVDANGVVQTGLDTRHSYIATVQQNEPTSALNSALREINLRVPPSLEPLLRQTAQRLCRDATSARVKSRRVSEFFQKNFRYSLDRKELSREVEPIQQFLETRHAAHCEYFASATALLLRATGVPARYVTGYVVDEESDEYDYWIGRNADAHAWVEAYDDDSRRWFIVESTPGRTVPAFNFGADQSTAEKSESGAEAAAGESGYEFDIRLISMLKAGQWSLALVELSELLRWPLALFTILSLVLMYRKQVQARPDEVDKHQAEFSKRLRYADRQMKRVGLYRGTAETIHSFAERIESVNETTPVDGDRAEWYREFAERRYKSLSPARLRPFPR
jgi:hypothetical protein